MFPETGHISRQVGRGGGGVKAISDWLGREGAILLFIKKLKGGSAVSGTF